MHKTKSILHIDPETTINYYGHLQHQSFCPIFTDVHGLLLIGGENINNQNNPNKHVLKVEFMEKNFVTKTLTKLSYSAVNPSPCEINDKLFVCGGWWDEYNLNEFYMYDLRYSSV